MHSWSEADGDVVEGLGLGLGLVLVGLGLGLGEVVVGVGDGVAEALVDVLALGEGVALAEALAEALADVLALGEGVALLTDTAVSWAAHGFVAAGAAVALLISKIPVSPARSVRNPEIRPNARVAAHRLLMRNALATVVILVRVALAAMVSLSTRVAFPASLIRHLAG